jgi:hypothetical protein
MRHRTGLAAFVTVLTTAGVLAATSQPAGETFQTVRTALSGELFRGVSFAPGTPQARQHP